MVDHSGGGGRRHHPAGGAHPHLLEGQCRGVQRKLVRVGEVGGHGDRTVAWCWDNPDYFLESQLHNSFFFFRKEGGTFLLKIIFEGTIHIFNFLGKKIGVHSAFGMELI